MSATPHQPTIAVTETDNETEGAQTMSHELSKTDRESKEVLTDEEYRALRQNGPERALSHPYHDLREEGVLRCATVLRACRRPIWCVAQPFAVRQTVEGGVSRPMARRVCS